MTQLFDDQNTLAFTILAVIISLWLIVSVAMKIWPFLSKLVTMVNGFVGYEGESGLLDRVKTLEENSASESRNHAKMSEQFDRVEAKITLLTERLDESAADRKRLWEMARKHHQGEIEE